MSKEMCTHMARATGTQAAAIRRRTKHEKRIAEQGNPLQALAQTWAWVFAEAKRVPHLLPDLTDRVHALAVTLNDCEARPVKEENR
jgi:hypothetical protein